MSPSNQELARLLISRYDRLEKFHLLGQYFIGTAAITSNLTYLQLVSYSAKILQPNILHIILLSASMENIKALDEVALM
jgi:hypothetical protein